MLVSKIDHQDNRSKTLVIGRTSTSDDNELPVTEIVSALSAENSDQILHQDEETRSGVVITPLNLNCTVRTKIMSANSKEHASEDHFSDCSQFENCSIISEPYQPSNFYENMDKNFDVLGSDSQTPLRKTTIISDSQIKQFYFKLTSQEWTSLKPINGSKGLSSNRCDIFASKIANFNPRCVFIFFYNHVSHPTSRRNCQYFKGKAKCKIPSCQVIIKLSITKQSVVKGDPKEKLQHLVNLFIRIMINSALEISLAKKITGGKKYR